MQFAPSSSAKKAQPWARPGGNIGDRTFGLVLRIFSWATIALFVSMLVFLFQLSWEAIESYGPAFWFRSDWNPPLDEFGAAPFIVGTIASSLIAVLIAAPISIGTAIFFREIAPQGLSKVVAFLVELLAAIPSVVYGLWGIFVLAPVLRENVQPFLANWFGPDSYFAFAVGHIATAFLYPFALLGNLLGLWDITLGDFSTKMMSISHGVFDGPPLGLGLLTSGIVLAIMIIPTVTSISREVLLAVPDSVREAALGLGATRWEMIRLALLKTARAGLVGAVILGMGRAIGETMAVTMVIGNRNVIPNSLFEPAQTMASVIANEYNESDGLHLSSLAFVGLSLFMIALVVNYCARLFVRYLERGRHA